MKDELYMPNQLVASIGRQCETIIVPYQGELLQYIPTLDIREVVKVGMLLGECSIIRREFWNGEVYSLGWTRAYILNPVDVKDIGRMFPKDYLKILRNFKKSVNIHWIYYYLGRFCFYFYCSASHKMRPNRVYCTWLV